MRTAYSKRMNAYGFVLRPTGPRTYKKLPNIYPQPGRTRAKSSPYLTIAIHWQMTSCVQVALHSSVIHHPGEIRKSSPERDHLAIPVRPSVARVAECEERLVGIGLIRSWPPSICLPGSGVWRPSFYLRSTRTRCLQPCMQHLIPLYGDRTTCCLPPLASIFWITSPLADSPFRCLLFTTALLIHMIICCTLTRQ